MKDLYRKPFCLTLWVVAGLLYTSTSKAQTNSVPNYSPETNPLTLSSEPSQKAPIQAVQLEPASCYGTQDGRATLRIAEHIHVAQIWWEDQQLSENRVIQDLNPGKYRVAVVDEAGHTYRDSIVIESRYQLVAEAVVIADVSTEGAQDGIAAVQVLSSQGPFSFHWDGLPNAHEAMVGGLDPGMYTVTVRDSRGCETTEAVSIIYNAPSSPVPGQANHQHERKSVEIFPNPSAGEVRLNTVDPQQFPESMFVFDVSGRKVLTKSEAWQDPIDLSELPAGIYTVVLAYSGEKLYRKLMLN